MDPISLGLSILGAGSSLFGSVSNLFDSGRSKEINDQIYQQEMRANAVRQQAMYLNASRQQTENIRNMQRARSMALNAATNQGAQFGTGLQGGYGQISGQGEWNALGTSQALQQGQQMFNIDNNISYLKSQLSDVQSDMYTNQGISSLGASIAGLSGKGFLQGFGHTGTGAASSNLPTYGNFLNLIGSNGIY